MSLHHQAGIGRSLAMATRAFKFTVVTTLLAFAGALGAEPTAPARVAIVGAPTLDPESAQTPLVVTVEVRGGGQAAAAILECEVLDYWFRPSYLRREVALAPGRTDRYTLEIDGPTRERLFKARYEFGQNVFEVNVRLKQGDKLLGHAKQQWTFRTRVKKYDSLPPLAEKTETLDEPFGACRLIDEVRCFDPADPHPYFEGGRGLRSKYTGAVPQIDWVDLYRERGPCFTSVQTVCGESCRATHGWGWFAYKLNRRGLTPGAAYVVVVEYPEDVGRTYMVWNTGCQYGFAGDHGFHTGKTLGDHWTRTLNAGYTNYPLSGRYARWHSLFYLADRVWAPGGTVGQSWADSRDGFWVVIGGVGPSMDPLSAGAAVRTIRLYQVPRPAALGLKPRRPPRELGRREIFATSESNGNEHVADLPRWARERLAEAQFYGFSGLAPYGGASASAAALLEAERVAKTGTKILPRFMFSRELFGRLNLPADGSESVLDARGQVAGLPYPGMTKPLPDILHPRVLGRVCAELDRALTGDLHNPALCGALFFKHYEAPITVSFSDRALERFERETGARLPAVSSQARRDWLLANKKREYYAWWFGKEREFLLAVRDHLQELRPDLKLHYFPWHSDDDFPFSCGRLRYSGYPELDKVYVPGTNILLVPSFTTPREKWSPELQLDPAKARHFYREQIDPSLAGKISLEDLLYGRHRDRPEFWDAPRSGALPHLVYPEQMDLVGMLTEPGGMYANNVGVSPRLYRHDRGIVYWAPVHYRFTADNPALLDLFRTGEGVAMANCFPYNEEIGSGNCYGLLAALAMEHGGPFCMMEEVLAMAHADPTSILTGMWPPPKRGFPKYARAFAAAYLALPAVPSNVLADVVQPSSPHIVVRQYRTAYGTYLAVVHRAFDLNQREVSITLDPQIGAVAAIEDLVNGQRLAWEPAAGRAIRFHLRLEPMSLRSLRIVPRVPQAVLRDVEVQPATFSPNGDGVRDLIRITGDPVEEARGRHWRCTIRDSKGQASRTFDGQGRLEAVWDGKASGGTVAPDGDYHAEIAFDGLPAAAYRTPSFALRNTPPAPPVVEGRQGAVVRFAECLLSGTAAPGLVRAWTDPGQVLERRVGRDRRFEIPVANLQLGANLLQLQSISDCGVASAVAPQRITFEPQWLAPDAKTLLFVDYTQGLNAQAARGDPQALAHKTVGARDGVQMGEGTWLNYASAGNLHLASGSLEMWFKPQWNGSDKNSAVLFSEYAGSDQNRQFLRVFKHIDGRILFGAGRSQYQSRGIDVSDWKAGVWRHLQFCWTADSLCLILDGQRSSRLELSPAERPTELEPRFWIGSWKQSDPSYRGPIWSRGWSHCVIRQLRIQNE